MAKKQAFDWNLHNIRLTSQDEPYIQKIIDDNRQDPLRIIDQFAGDGYKISVRYVFNSSSYVVTLTATDDAKFNAKSSLTAWADDVYEALCVLAYKHYTLSDGEEWITRNSEGGWQ